MAVMAVEKEATDPDLVVELVDRLRAVPASVDLQWCPEPMLRRLIRDIRSAQRCLEALVIQVAARADELADAGLSAPAHELLQGDGQV